MSRSQKNQPHLESLSSWEAKEFFSRGGFSLIPLRELGLPPTPSLGLGPDCGAGNSPATCKLPSTRSQGHLSSSYCTLNSVPGAGNKKSYHRFLREFPGQGLTHKQTNGTTATIAKRVLSARHLPKCSMCRNSFNAKDSDRSRAVGAHRALCWGTALGGRHVCLTAEGQVEDLSFPGELKGPARGRVPAAGRLGLGPPFVWPLLSGCSFLLPHLASGSGTP